eukprot:scaffold2534_cov176-Alexandrium_tamarense.AAC.4
MKSIIYPLSVIVVSISLVLIHHDATAQLLPDEDPAKDYYCGMDWNEANTYCAIPCPSGLDTDCPVVETTGRIRYCFASSGCSQRVENLYWDGIISLEFDKANHLANTGVETSSNASTAAMNDTTTTIEIPLMTNEEAALFEDSFMFFLNQALKQKMDITCSRMQSQEYDRPCVGVVSGRRQLMDNTTDFALIGDDFRETPNITTSSRRRLARDASMTALDLEVQVCADYIPIGGTNKFTVSDFGGFISGAIDDNQQGFVDTLSSSSPFFDALTGISTISLDDIAEAPSSFPSESPTRSNDQVIETYLDTRPSGSYGLVFSVRTPANVSSILLTGMKFLTKTTTTLEYEVYTKLGTHTNSLGLTFQWDLIASGVTTGMGPEVFTSVLSEDSAVITNGIVEEYVGFKPVHVPGNRGQRSFYITVTKKYKAEDGSPIPLLFSYNIKAENDGKAIYEIVEDGPELEIYEGDGVLDYPFPRDKDGTSPYYRRPRGFIGGFEYDKNPCRPTSGFFGWPCPYVVSRPQPTRDPTPRPTPLPTAPSIEETQISETITNIPSSSRVATSKATASPISTLNSPVEDESNESVDPIGASTQETSSAEYWGSGRSYKVTLVVSFLCVVWI